MEPTSILDPSALKLLEEFATLLNWLGAFTVTIAYISLLVLVKYFQEALSSLNR